MCEISSQDMDFDFSSKIAELQRELDLERKKEEQIDEKITEILRQNVDLPRQLNHVLNRMRSKLALIESDSSQLSSSLSLTSILAENVSGKVRDLDVAKSHVVDCLQRVEDLQDLRLSTEGVQSALLNEDYEQAAAHIHRFLALDSAVFQMGEEFDSKGSDKSPGGGGAGSVRGSYEVLREAERDLKKLVEEKFDEAVKDGDVASMERFFKIFPLLYQHELGLRKFATYLRSKISDTAEKNYKIMMGGGQDDARTSVLYADALTMLFEGIARVIEIHQPLVQTYYGPERMLTLADHLQEECDLQADKIINEFVRARQFASKSKLIDTYHRQSSKYASLEKLEPLELDVLLSEVTLLHTRGELYLRFLKRRVGADLASLSEEHPHKQEKLKELEKLLKGCLLSRKMQELIGSYIAMEQYYMEECVKKAVAMDQKEHNKGVLTSSMVEDVFFIIRKCGRRSLSSSSVDCVCAMLNNACTMLETEYVHLIRGQLKAGYPQVGSVQEAYVTAAAAYSSMMQQGKIPASSAEGADKARIDFLTALNNSSNSADCVQELKETLEVDIEKHLSGLASHDRDKINHCLGQLAEVMSTLRESAKAGVDQLVSSAVKPRLRSMMDKFLDYSHSPTDSEFADFEANDPFMQNFLQLLDELLQAFQPVLTDGNYQEFLTATSSETARQLEKYVKKVTFNRLGGLQFDKELRDLSGYLTSVTGWAVREKFARLSQMAMIVNVESVVEAKEYYGSDTVTWRLTPNEFRQILALRVDLPGDEVRKLQL